MVSKDSELKSHKKQQKEENSERFREIKDVLRKNQITRGVTPEKLRMILEELGPTYIKLGQIMSLHSDFLPKAYCDELLKLNSDVDVYKRQVLLWCGGRYRNDNGCSIYL